MRTLIMMWIAAAAVLSPAGAHAQNACEQTVSEMRTALLGNVRAQGAARYPEFKISVLEYFSAPEITSIALAPTLGGRDSRSDRTTGRIYLANDLWCTRPDLRKQSILLHAYLVLMKTEEELSFNVSDRFIPQAEEVANERKWLCRSSNYAYETVARLPTDILVGPLRNGNVSPMDTGPFYGPNASVAFDKLRAAAATAVGANGSHPCVRVQRNDAGPVNPNYTQHVTCIEEASPANSCIQQF